MVRIVHLNHVTTKAKVKTTPPSMNSAHKKVVSYARAHILNHVIQMASEGEVVRCRDCWLLKVDVLSISVSRILSRGKRSSFVLDIVVATISVELSGRKIFYKKEERKKKEQV